MLPGPQIPYEALPNTPQCTDDPTAPRGDTTTTIAQGISGQDIINNLRNVGTTDIAEDIHPGPLDLHGIVQMLAHSAPFAVPPNSSCAESRGQGSARCSG